MLGHYTHFGNLLDLLGISVPQGTTADGRPHAAMLLGDALSDDTVLHLAAELLDEPRAHASVVERPELNSVQAKPLQHNRKAVL